MKARILAAAAVAIMACAGGGSHAADNALNLGRMTPGYSYFNRPRADMALHNADLGACLVDAANLRSVREKLGSGSGILGALIEGAATNSASRGVISASIENCMVVRGWRVVHLDDVEGAALSALTSDDLAKRLAPWIGAEIPHGTVVRSWHNDAALGAVNHFSLHAQHTRNGQLSVLALGTSVSEALKADQAADAAMTALKVGKIALDPKWPRKPLKPEALDSVPPEAAIIVVAIKGMGMRQGNGFVFTRMGSDPNRLPSYEDHAPDTFSAAAGWMSGGGEGKFVAFALPPGRWRAFSMVNGLIVLNLCLGSPAFEAKAGEVVYAGLLDLKQDKLEPALDLASARAWMSGAKAAERLRPASYVNGTRGPCGDDSNAIYALEFDDAPFEPAYALGSKVKPLP